MATESLSIVAPSGGDYTSLSAWEAGEQADIVTADVFAVAEIQGTWGLTDSTEFAIDGWTTDATRYIEIRTNSANRHAGVWDAGKYVFDYDVNGVYYGIGVLEAYVKLIGLQFYRNASGGYHYMVDIAPGVTSKVEVDRCLFKGNGASTTGANAAGINVSGGSTSAYITNCIFWDFKPTTEVGAGLRVSGGAWIYNCTFHNCDFGIWDQYGYNPVVKNCLAQDCDDGFFTAGTITGSYNCSDIASDAPGTSPVTGTVTFANEAGDDFHLASGDTVAKDAGTDLSADSAYPFSIDIDGATRTGTWDIGADEYVSGGGALTLDISDSISLSDAPANEPRPAYTEAITMSEALVKAFAQGALADTIALADSIAKEAQLSKADAIALTDSLTKDFAQALADTIALAEALATDVSPGAFSDSIALSDSVATAIVLILGLAESISLSDAVVKEAQINPADAVALAEAISFVTGKSLSDALVLADDLAKLVALAHSDSFSLADLSAAEILGAVELVNLWRGRRRDTTWRGGATNNIFRGRPA